MAGGSSTHCGAGQSCGREGEFGLHLKHCHQHCKEGGQDNLLFSLFFFFFFYLMNFRSCGIFEILFVHPTVLI